ncbi:MAG: putative lipoprotein YiaD [Paracidovorax wautersii]|uniref:Putative lipoprotein YiaD n=1 Tax=Paracidovorax wautersii TaxID=1177982 RepID=A0A7V8JR05_9BURK|nr:MAG: putative lipoprotein YiaD [Paracidovorax wautersii]
MMTNNKQAFTRLRAGLAAAALAAVAATAAAQQVGAHIENVPGANAGQVVAGGQVPDEATRVALLEALRKVYGAGNVVDRLEVVGSIATPPNWSANVQKLLTPSLKQIRKGQLQIEGTQLVVNGEVGNEAVKQKLLSDMANSLNPTYTIRNNLQIPAVGSQQQVDQALANRTIEFETGSAMLTPRGRQVLDEVVPVLNKLEGRQVALVGHTDNSGDRQLNLTLSQARADAVKGYLVDKGIDPARLTTSGVGPDQPVAANDSAEGRAKNRRIEFRVGDR